MKDGDSSTCLSYTDIEEVIKHRIQIVAKALPKTRITVVPHVDDVTMDCCLPQMPIDWKDTPVNVSCVPNPTTLDIDGGKLKIGVLAADAVTELMNSGIFIAKTRSNTLREQQKIALASMFSQRNWFPIFPSKSTFVDYARLSSLTLESLPDIIIIPSKTDPFVEEICEETHSSVDKVLFINPGSTINLDGEKEGGYLARIVIVNDASESAIAPRTKIEILRVQS